MFFKRVYAKEHGCPGIEQKYNILKMVSSKSKYNFDYSYFSSGITLNKQKQVKKNLHSMLIFSISKSIEQTCFVVMMRENMIKQNARALQAD